jgi:segregation and condensation protein A
MDDHPANGAHPSAATMTEYTVRLDIFRGPLDLLLYLVKSHEVDIRDIPIARVTAQFLEYLRVLEMIDVERVGEFLVMAATLMEIKSRMLLPRPEESSSEEDDPRRELVKQLLEYKKYKDAAALLEAQGERWQSRFNRLPPPATPLSLGEMPIASVELWDLVSAFGRLMRETLALQPKQIVVDETPIEVHVESIVARLRETPRLEFAQIFTPPHTRGKLIGLFLALLELIKRRQVVVEQERPFGEIWIAVRPEESA